jgi:hypothetical protein
VRSTDDDRSQAEGARRRGLGSVRIHYKVALALARLCNHMQATDPLSSAGKVTCYSKAPFR